MRVCTFRSREKPPEALVGVVVGAKVFALTRQRPVAALLSSAPEDFETEEKGHDLASVTFGAPVPRPGKIIATIVNTQAMLGGEDITLDRPRLDMKAPSSVIGPGDEVLAPRTGVRPEVELAAVVGRRISKASEKEAASSFFGYTILNDVTAPTDSREDAYEAYRRDKVTGVIRKTTMRGPLFRSKNHDGFCPMGPWVSTPDEVPGLSDLRMTTKFDGLLVQDGATSEYLFSPAAIASYVSQFLSLDPGDVVSCGSVGWTKEALGELDPTEYVLPLRSGKLELEIEGIGKLTNPVTVAR